MRMHQEVSSSAPLYGLTSDDLADFGVTRIGDLTGLDTIGVPVWFACRPNSRSLSQSQGKGHTPQAARASATMEALEQHFAENAFQLEGCLSASFADVVKGNTLPINLKLAAGCSYSKFDKHRQRGWCRGRSIKTGADVLAPYELVGLDFRIDAGWDRITFQNSTTGLCAGSTEEDAILHGLLEVVESNATLLPDAIGPLRQLMTPVIHAPGLDHNLDNLVNQVSRAGLQARFSLLGAPAGLPVFGAFLSPGGSVGAGEPAAMFSGYACKLSSTRAATAALLEAIQSRLTDIAGARDDIDPADYEKRAQFEVHDAEEHACTFRDLDDRWNDCAKQSSADALPMVVEALIKYGVDDVCWFDLTRGRYPFSVGRIIVPGLEHVGHEGGGELGAEGIGAIMRAAARLG